MTEISVANFVVNFKRQLIQLEGLICFAAFAFWIIALWDELLARLRGSWADRIWLALCLAFGIFIAIACMTDWGTEYALISISVGLSIGLAMANATAAVCFMCALILMRPWELIADNDYFLMLPKLSFGICTAHLFLKASEKKLAALNWDTCTTFAVGFALWAFVTTLRTSDPAASQLDYFETLFKAIFLFLMVSFTLSTSRQLAILLWTVILSFLGIGAIALYHSLGMPAGGNEFTERLEAYGAWANSNDIAAFMVMIFPFSLIMFRRRTVPLAFRGFALASMGVAVATIYLSQSRGAMIGMAAMISLMAWLQTRRKLVKIALIGCALVSVPLYIAHSTRSESDLTLSSESRKTILEAGLRMAAKNPVFGVGFGAFPQSLPEYARGPLNENNHMTAHSTWILVLAETGLPGILLYLSLFFYAFRMAWSVFGTAPEYLLSLVGYGLAISFLSHSYLICPFLLLAMVGAAGRTLGPTGALHDYA